MTDISFPLALAAGVLSFLSPCVLPLVPSYVSFITGVSFEDLTGAVDRKRIRRLTISNSLAFILGFSTVFIALGASSSFFGSLMLRYQDWFRIAGGTVIIILGLFVAGIIKLNFLLKDRKLHLSGKPVGYIGTFVVGMTFAAGWTPCIGPILGTILVYAGSKASAVYGFQLLAVYSLGLAIPFFIASLAMNTFLSYSRKIVKHMGKVMVASGLLLIAFGVMLLTNQIGWLTTLFPDIGIRL